MTATPRSRPVGVGIIGAGTAARQHLAVISACPDVHAVAVADAEPQAAHRLVAEQPEAERPVARRDVEQLLDDERIGLIAIATPPGSHRDLALQVIAAGRAVLLEKPPLLTCADLDVVTGAADAAGLVAGVMLQHRFRVGPALTGRPWTGQALASVEVVRHRPAHHYEKAQWRTDPRASGGGLLAHLGVHYLDLACQLLGVPEDVNADVDTLPGTGIDQRVVLRARLSSGAGLTFAGSTALRSFAERLAVHDVDRKVVIEPSATSYAAEEREWTEQAPATPELRSRVYADVAAAVREDRRPRVAQLHTARGVVRLLELCRSALTRDAVTA